ncbi:hypothetical protein DFH94DRAFT_733438 [Russula ochroleuca]|uniref:Uncharacterized protein n=1 Tax=Russula ochroleuca TaxID=152965 RepID=A0A9P5MYD8_9AGAM|nr:hypothetical protein DFH94DRAFT_733438 [Russula ochroleuca]
MNTKWILVLYFNFRAPGMAYPRGEGRHVLVSPATILFFYLVKRAPHCWQCLSNVKPNAGPKRFPCSPSLFLCGPSTHPFT